MTRPDVSIAIVTYNTRELALACLGSIARNRDCGGRVVEVLVVDSASTDQTVEAVRRQYPWARVIASPRNLGYTGGNNLAARLARGRYVLFLNPDTVVEPGAVEALASQLDRCADVGAVGPRLHFPNGQVQSSRRRFPGRLTGLVESLVFQRWLGGLPIVRRFYMEDRSDSEAQDVDWLVGACLMVRREALERSGLFDERFFMYSEEVDLCRRLRSDGWRVVFEPSAVVVHHEGKSSEQNLFHRERRFHQSRAMYYEKHVGRGWSLLLRAATAAHFALLLAEETAKLVLRPASAPLRRARIERHGRLLRLQAAGLVAALAGRR